MKIIWRVENENKTGCYYGSNVTFLKYHSKGNNHPEPYDDKGINRDINSAEICGFINEQQAKKWFTKLELILLKNEGFPLKKIKVKEITAIGETQILAIR